MKYIYSGIIDVNEKYKSSVSVQWNNATNNIANAVIKMKSLWDELKKCYGRDDVLSEIGFESINCEADNGNYDAVYSDIIVTVKAIFYEPVSHLYASNPEEFVFKVKGVELNKIGEEIVAMLTNAGFDTNFSEVDNVGYVIKGLNCVFY